MGRRAKTKKLKFIFFLLLAVAVVTLAWWYLANHQVAILQPAGQTGQKERRLIEIAGLLALIVVIPVYAMTVMIALRYREGSGKSRKYSPEWDRQPAVEFTWWAIPMIIIGILSAITWSSSHDLDPSKALAASQPRMRIQVVSLDWKWLFIYPDQHVASVNFAQIPVDTPVDFEVTSDSVMNSFWVPQLGGQIYAMPGMLTQLNLLADKAGNFNGASANISGQGFAGMNFTMRAGTQADFYQWVKLASSSPHKLDQSAYSSLAKPSKNNPVSYYSSVQDGLFDNVPMRYMLPASQLNAGGMGMPGMGM